MPLLCNDRGLNATASISGKEKLSKALLTTSVFPAITLSFEFYSMLWGSEYNSYNSYSSDRYLLFGKRLLTIAAMYAELPPSRNGEHNSESKYTLDRGLIPLKGLWHDRWSTFFGVVFPILKRTQLCIHCSDSERSFPTNRISVTRITTAQIEIKWDLITKT